MRRRFRENGLSLVLVTLFLVFVIGQSIAGHRQHNNDQREHGRPPVEYLAYLGTPHFWEALAEN